MRYGLNLPKSFIHPFNLFEAMERDLENVWQASPHRREDFFSPAVEIDENDSGFLLSFDIPGIRQEDIHLEAQDRVLKVWGERKKELKNEKYSEKFYGRFERSFSLPEGADSEQIEARFNNGVLNVYIPKKAAVIPQKIEVKSGETSWGQQASLENKAQ